MPPSSRGAILRPPAGPAGGEKTRRPPLIAIVRRESHRFQGAGRHFLYLVPSAAIFEVDETGIAVLDLLDTRGQAPHAIVDALSDRFSATAIQAALDELLDVRAIGYEHRPDADPPRMLPKMPFPLSTMVMNVTNQCNLACTYCYEYGEDKIVDTEHGK